MTEIRVPSEEDRERAAQIMRVSMNLGAQFVERRAALFDLEQMRCAYDHDRMIATAGARRFTQWFGGQELAMEGIWGVATLPEHRGSGLATATVTTLLREAREDGVPISALFPAIVRPYRGLGYELAGTHTEHEVELDDLPRGPVGPLDLEEYEADRDLEDVRACYRRAMAPHNGPIDCDDATWWPETILSHRTPDEIHRVAVARGPSGIEAYTSFVQEKAKGDFDVSFRLSCKHLVASTIEGYATLLGYIRGFRGLGQAVRFTGPPADPIAFLLEEQRVRPAWTFRWMLRLLDVPTALERRGYPSASGEAVILVDDGLFPQNRGPWRIVAEDGKVSVTPAERATTRPIQIGALSSMFTGYLSPLDAVRLRLLARDDPVVPLFAKLFSGPSPFMLEFF